MPEIIIIAAIDSRRGLARSGRIPWDVPSDRQQFRSKIRGKTVIFGGKTYDDIKPMLDSCDAYVVTRQDDRFEGAKVIRDLPAFLAAATQDVWVIGGSEIFALALPYATRLDLTRIKGDFGCDTFFPDFRHAFKLARKSPSRTENGIDYSMEVWLPRPKDLRNSG